jgi:hypothetical protein
MSQQALELARVEFGTFRKPEQVVDEAAHVARVFQNKMLTILDSAQQPILYRMFGKSRHITRPGWQLLGSMFRVTAGIVPGTCKYIEFPGDINGFEATAEAIYVPTGARISTADGMCLNDEDNWNLRPEYDWVRPEGGGEKVKTQIGEVPVPLYQLRSMCQTRACSKVLSNLLSYVAIMAGCSGTTAEEMPSDGGQTGAQPSGQAAPQRTQNGNGCITEPQVNRLFAITKSAGKSREALGVILAAHGYSVPADHPDPVDAAARLVKKGDFDKIQTEVMKPV